MENNNLKDIMMEWWNNRSKPVQREYKIYTSEFGIRMYNAVLLGDQKELEELNRIITERRDADEARYKPVFIEKYGLEMYEWLLELKGRDELIRHLSKDVFSVWTKDQYYTDEDGDNVASDDYYSINFYKGVLSYREDYCGGYAGGKVIEDDITIDRAKEIINTHDTSK